MSRDISTAACAWCGKPFTGKYSPLKKYCGSSCGQKAYLRRTGRVGGRTTTPMPCVWCGAKYVPTTATQKYCSRQCSKKAFAAKAQAREYRSPLPFSLAICPYEAGAIRMEGQRMPDPGWGF